MSDPIAAAIFEQAERISENWKASLLVDLALVSLLVEAGVLNAEAVVARVENLQNHLDMFQSPGVMLRVEPLLMRLRDMAVD